MQPNDTAEDHHEAQKKPALDDLPDVPFNPNKIDENAKESVRRQIIDNKKKALSK